MSSPMSVTGADLEAVAAHAQETAEQLGREAQQLSSEISEFLSSNWQGQASDKFRAGFEEWFDGAQKLHTWLTSLGERVSESAKEYASMEEANQAALRQVGQSIPGAGA
ncbi:MAG: WXG100 family type VII secretion target [Segniliparus sp.]|uniref:WXG100 family type VII secretion target n=1 Tax=Segniliparus sp. TaxID=2804064 RepID=UPI003F3F8380